MFQCLANFVTICVEKIKFRLIKYSIQITAYNMSNVNWSIKVMCRKLKFVFFLELKKCYRNIKAVKIFGPSVLSPNLVGFI